MRHAQRRYLSVVATVVVIPLLLVMLCNFLADPFRVYRTVNLVPNHLDSNNSYVTAAENFNHALPEKVVVGSSRVVDGFRESDSVENSTLALPFKVAVRGTSWDEQKRILEYLIAHRNPPKHLVLAMDLDTVLRKSRPSDFAHSRFAVSIKAVDYHACNLLSMHALKKSLESVSPSGAAVDKIDEIVQQQGSHRVFKRQLRRKIEMHAPDETVARIDQSIRELASVIGKAKSQAITFEIAILPVHALSIERLHRSGYGSSIDSLKRQLADLASQQNVHLWDFASYSSIATERVPRDSNEGQRMKWFYDSDHFTPELGDLIVQRMNQSPNPSKGIRDLGCRVDKTNIESHLSEVRLLRAKYLQSKPWELDLLDSPHSLQDKRAAGVVLAKNDNQITVLE